VVSKVAALEMPVLTNAVGAAAGWEGMQLSLVFEAQ